MRNTSAALIEMQLPALSCPNIKREQVLITPAMAEDWLKTRNTRNRNISKKRVDAIARDIRAGHWRLSNITIAILENGVLGDGQHRLLAIVQANIPVVAFVETGWPLGTPFDDPRIRTFADNLGIDGEKSTVKLQAASDMLFRYAHGWSRGGATLTQDEMKEALNAFPSIRESAHFFAGAGPRLRVAAVSVAYTLARLGYPDKADKFFGDLKDGEYLSKGSPVLALRNRILTATDWAAFTRNKHWLLFNMIAKAWNAYVQGNSMTQARVGDCEIATNIMGFPAAAALRTLKG